MAEVWGPSMWAWLHHTAAYYPTKPSAQQQKEVKRVLFNLGSLIPCEQCREHYTQYLHTNPVDTLNRESFSRWVDGLHNAVNKKRGVPTWSRLRSRLQSGPGGRRHLLMLVVCFLVSLALWHQASGARG